MSKRYMLPTVIPLPSAPDAQVSGEQDQQEPGAAQDLGRRKGGMHSFVLDAVLFTLSIACVGMFVFFPNDGMGPDPVGDEITGKTVPYHDLLVPDCRDRDTVLSCL